MNDATTCRCRRLVFRGGRQVMLPGGKPLVLATFANGKLVRVQRIHWGVRDRCPLPAEELDVKDWIVRVRLPDIKRPRGTKQRVR